MTSRAGSFLIRIEATDDGRWSGTLTSVQTGERADFDGTAELTRLLERWAAAADPRGRTEEETS